MIEVPMIVLIVLPTLEGVALGVAVAAVADILSGRR